MPYDTKPCRLDGSRLLQLAPPCNRLWLGMLELERLLAPGAAETILRRLQAYGIAVEVDRPQHFCGTCFGTVAEVQDAWDRRLGDECQWLGQQLVQLHSADTCEC